MGEGSLAGEFTHESKFNDWRKDYFTPARLKEVTKRTDILKEAMVNSRRTLAQIALNFCPHENGADTAIVGMRNPKHVPESTASLDLTFQNRKKSF